jgi:phage/plasmid-associated DNA primase
MESSKIQITITKQKNKLQGIELEENINKYIICQLLNTDLIINNDEYNEEKHIKDLKKEIKDDMKTVIYETKGVTWGRVYPADNLSLSTIRRQLKHTVAFNSHKDIDIENAHPNILEQICKSNNINCEKLSYYIHNRNELLISLMKHYFNFNDQMDFREKKQIRDQVKELLIKYMYGGGFDAWKTKYNIKQNETQYLFEYKTELKTITDIIMNFNQDFEKDIINYTKKLNLQNKKNNKNIKEYHRGKALSYYIQEIERRILEIVFFYLRDDKKKIKNEATLCHDGILIPNNSYYDGILEDLNKIVLQKTGFNLKFTNKEMDEHYLEEIKDIEPIDLDDLGEIFKSSKLLGDYMIKNLFNNNIKTHQEIKKDEQQFIIYDNIKNVWKTYLTTEIKQMMINFIEKYEKKLMKEYNYERIDMDRIYKQCNLNEMIEYIGEKTLDNLFLEKLNINKDVLNFKNGLLDLKTGLFRDRKPDDNICGFLDYDYQVDKKQNLINEIKEMLLKIYNDDKKLLDDILLFYSYCITGRTNEQKFLINIGQGGNGKSLLGDLLRSKVLPLYCAKTTFTTFTTDCNENNIGKAIHPLILFKKRILFVEEMTTQKLNLSFLKDITGSDTIDYKKLNIQSSSTAKHYVKIIFNTNKQPNFDGDSNSYAIKRRGLQVEYKNTFIKEDDYNNMDDKKGFYIIDVNLLDKFNDDDYKCALLHILLEYSVKYYNDGELKLSSLEKNFESMVDENDITTNFMNEYYKKSNNEKDRILVDDIYNDYKNYILSKGINKKWTEMLFKTEMKKYSKKFYSEYKNDLTLCDLKKTDPRRGKKGVYVCMIRIKEDEEDEEIQTKQKIDL